MVRGVIGLCGLLVLALFAARVLGQAQAGSPRLAQIHLLDCAPPCWLGIMPGLTTITEAKNKIVAAFAGQSGVQIKDSGFADGYVFSNVIENAIEAEDFYLFIRLSIGELVDGKSEKVQSISLLTARGDGVNRGPTVADILGAFGPPRALVTEARRKGFYVVTFKYSGFDVTFFMQRGGLAAIPYSYLFTNAPPDPNAQPWKGFGLLSP